MIISDLARLIDTVHREKAIPREVLVEIIEQAMIAAARRKYGIEHDIEAHYHEELGEVELFEFKTVVEEIDDESGDILFDEARELDPECEVGDQLGVKMIVEDLGRIAAQTAKQVILQKIRDAEREMTFNEYRDRILELPGHTAAPSQLPVMPHVHIAGVQVVNQPGPGLRAAAEIDGRIDGVVSRIEVAADMEWGDSLPGAHRVKTAGVAFGGKDLGEILPHQEQVAHRVLVFEARQAAGRNTPLPTLPGEALFEKIAFQRTERLPSQFR